MDTTPKWSYFGHGNANIVLFNGQNSLLRVPLQQLAKDLYKDFKKIRHDLGAQHTLSTRLVDYNLQEIPVEYHDKVYDKHQALLVELVGEPDPQQFKVSSPDCTLTRYKHSVVLEFKPKWLAQSPNAPKNAKRCRTCALSMLRKRVLPSFCRLGLVDNSLSDTLTQMLAPFRRNPQIDVDNLVKVCTQAYKNSGILQTLSMLQLKDKHGILAYADEDSLPHDLTMAMTYRDCTLLTHVYDPGYGPEHATTIYNQNVIVKVIDLDVKPHKRPHWKTIELALQPYYLTDGARLCNLPPCTRRNPCPVLSHSALD